MSEHVYFLTLGLPLATILLIFAMRSFAAIRQAKARLAHDGAYREIAQKAAAAAAENATVLVSIDAALSEVRTRLTAIEKILKDVE